MSAISIAALRTLERDERLAPALVSWSQMLNDGLAASCSLFATGMAGCRVTEKTTDSDSARLGPNQATVASFGLAPFNNGVSPSAVDCSSVPSSPLAQSSSPATDESPRLLCASVSSFPREAVWSDKADCRDVEANFARKRDPVSIIAAVGAAGEVYIWAGLEAASQTTTSEPEGRTVARASAAASSTEAPQRHRAWGVMRALQGVVGRRERDAGAARTAVDSPIPPDSTNVARFWKLTLLWVGQLLALPESCGPVRAVRLWASPVSLLTLHTADRSAIALPLLRPSASGGSAGSRSRLAVGNCPVWVLPGWSRPGHAGLGWHVPLTAWPLAPTGGGDGWRRCSRVAITCAPSAEAVTARYDAVLSWETWQAHESAPASPRLESCVLLRLARCRPVLDALAPPTVVVRGESPSVSDSVGVGEFLRECLTRLQASPQEAAVAGLSPRTTGSSLPTALVLAEQCVAYCGSTGSALRVTVDEASLAPGASGSAREPDFGLPQTVPRSNRQATLLVCEVEDGGRAASASALAHNLWGNPEASAPALPIGCNVSCDTTEDQTGRQLLRVRVTGGAGSGLAVVVATAEAAASSSGSHHLTNLPSLRPPGQLVVTGRVILPPTMMLSSTVADAGSLPHRRCAAVVRPVAIAARRADDSMEEARTAEGLLPAASSAAELVLETCRATDAASAAAARRPRPGCIVGDAATAKPRSGQLVRLELEFDLLADAEHMARLLSPVGQTDSKIAAVLPADAVAGVARGIRQRHRVDDSLRLLSVAAERLASARHAADLSCAVEGMCPAVVRLPNGAVAVAVRAPSEAWVVLQAPHEGSSVARPPLLSVLASEGSVAIAIKDEEALVTSALALAPTCAAQVAVLSAAVPSPVSGPAAPSAEPAPDGCDWLVGSPRSSMPLPSGTRRLGDFAWRKMLQHHGAATVDSLATTDKGAAALRRRADELGPVLLDPLAIAGLSAEGSDMWEGLHPDDWPATPLDATWLAVATSRIAEAGRQANEEAAAVLARTMRQLRDAAAGAACSGAEIPGANLPSAADLSTCALVGAAIAGFWRVADEASDAEAMAATCQKLLGLAVRCASGRAWAAASACLRLAALPAVAAIADRAIPGPSASALNATRTASASTDGARVNDARTALLLGACTGLLRTRGRGGGGSGPSPAPAQLALRECASLLEAWSASAVSRGRMVQAGCLAHEGEALVVVSGSRPARAPLEADRGASEQDTSCTASVKELASRLQFEWMTL